jgi:CBS domain-containing protein
MKTNKESDTQQNSQKSNKKELSKESDVSSNSTLSASLIHQLCEKDVVCLTPDATILEVAKNMLDEHIGDVVIIKENAGKSVPVGIVTDRDIVINTIAKQVSPENVRMSEIMTHNIVTANENEDLLEVVEISLAP